LLPRHSTRLRANWLRSLVTRVCQLRSSAATRCSSTGRRGLTGDVDVVATRLVDALRYGEPLSFGGYQTEVMQVPVDFVVRDDDYAELYGDGLTRSTFLADAPMPVVRLEYLAAMKMGAGRPRDDADLEWIVLRSGVDLPWARRIVRQHLGTYAAREFDSFVEQARWRSSRGRAE
jgi:hypothetical protein